MANKGKRICSGSGKNSGDKVVSSWFYCHCPECGKYVEAHQTESTTDGRVFVTPRHFQSGGEAS
jgi:hypothetical protein